MIGLFLFKFKMNKLAQKIQLEYIKKNKKYLFKTKKIIIILKMKI